MKVALIGASGFVGSHILHELLERGHQVTAIVRHPEKISARHPNLVVKKGDVYLEGEVTELVKGQDAVISAFNPGWTNPNIYEDFLAGSQAIQQGVKAAGVRRLIIIGGAGSLEVAPGVQLIDTPQFPAEYKAGASGARDYLNIIKQEKELDWTFISPAIEMHPGTSGVRKGAYRTALDNPVFDENGRSILSVEDLALVTVDELEHAQHIRQRFTAAY
ncbi:NAD(P)-dependent oxidoreductase [uncultured Chitinophaga sp.]|jgi:Putative NADH-flavin reductase|uniref:NAD(P)-dependent oxidoreductase n=1 Tax=uncultured Chitinophaga sp. TaxID=339340 RepID=UPI00262A08E7|nr:NAD(P)-dependent oxidoreductase [uncultured Chitinophaga sp.]